MDDTSRSPVDLGAWKSALAADGRRVAARDRWGLALMVVGWVHLGSFLACQYLYDRTVRRDPRHLWLWVLDFAVGLVVVRLVAGRGWYRASPAAGVVVRVWVSFFLLAFNVVMLNNLTGWTVGWFKPVWATLSTFGFATMAWLFSARFLLPAVQMSFTGLLMVHYPHWNYLIYGTSWWLALQGVGLTLERQRT